MFEDPAYMAAAAVTVAERMVADLPPNTHPHTRAMQAVMQRLATGADALSRLYSAKSPTETEAAHQKKVAAAAKAFGQVASNARNQLNDIMQSGMRDIDQRARAKTGLKINEFAAEIRAAIRPMSIEDKITLFNDLAKQGRGAELAAVIDAPPLLSDVTPDLQQTAREMLEGYHAPAEARERTVLAAAMGQAFDMATVCMTSADYIAGDPRKLRAIEQGELAAAAAVEAFQAATRG